MKKLIAATFAALMFFAFEMAIPKSSEAGMTCSTDSWGNTQCYGTGSDSGYNTNMSTDSWGNTNIYDNQGGSMSCSTDSWGNTSCYQKFKISKLIFNQAYVIL